LGDEFLLKNPGFPRLNFVRDAIVLGQAWQWTDDWRLYGEVGWAFNTDGGSEQWETQFGVEYSPLRAAQTPSFFGARSLPGNVISSPVLAVNGYLREELNYSGSVTGQTGWQWRNTTDGRLFRIGLQIYSGASPQYQFFQTYEEQYGVGVWYDY
jgi:hypothetical protein